MHVKKYRIKCVTDDKMEVVISDGLPTKCPVNDSHTIDSTSATVIEHDIVVRDGAAMELTLANYKQLRYNEIDYKTSILISSGVAFDGETFSLSLAAQANWSILKDDEVEFTWPVTISTIDNNSYSLAQSDLSAFWNNGKDFVQGHLDSGRSLKKTIFDATDEATIDAVIDAR